MDTTGGQDSASFAWTVNQPNVVTVTNPGSQTNTIGASPSLQMQVSDSATGQTFIWSATGLPAGLSINSSSGLISGTRTTTGSSSVTVTAQGATGASGDASFTRGIAPDTTRTTVKLSSATTRYGHEQVERLSVTVTAGGVATATGTVTVKAGSKTVCTIALSNGLGSCKLTASQLKVGTYSVVANYRGNTDFELSSSPKVKLKVT